MVKSILRINAILNQISLRRNLGLISGPASLSPYIRGSRSSQSPLPLPAHQISDFVVIVSVCILNHGMHQRALPFTLRGSSLWYPLHRYPNEDCLPLNCLDECFLAKEPLPRVPQEKTETLKIEIQSRVDEPCGQ